MKRTGNKIPKTIGRLLVLVLLPFASTGQDTVKITRHEFSIQQAIDYANKNNVNVKNALLDIKLQELYIISFRVYALAFIQIHSCISIATE